MINSGNTIYIGAGREVINSVNTIGAWGMVINSGNTIYIGAGREVINSGNNIGAWREVIIVELLLKHGDTSGN